MTVRAVAGVACVLSFCWIAFDLWAHQQPGAIARDINSVLVGSCGGAIQTDSIGVDCKRNQMGVCSMFNTFVFCPHQPNPDRYTVSNCNGSALLSTACGAVAKKYLGGSGDFESAGNVPCGSTYTVTPCVTSQTSTAVTCSHGAAGTLVDTYCNPGPAGPAQSCGSKASFTSGC